MPGLGHLGDNIGLIATYTDLLEELDPGLSMEACHTPVVLPCVDPNAMMRHMPQLQFSCPPDLSDVEENRLW